jgi:6-phosphogluconolactonase (cycloisomerase 2 family)
MTVLYTSIGPELIHYDMDVKEATLTRRGTVAVAANIQYVWPHVSRRYLYVASSDSASGMGPVGKTHHVSAFRIDPATGALSPHGAPIPLPHRPIHMSTDLPSDHVLVAFNNPPSVRIYRIEADATLGAEVAQPPETNPGIFPHQILPFPDNRHIVVPARGFDASGDKPEQPGSLHIFRNDNGVLRDGQAVAPNGGFGFGPRHLDFHQTRPWIYVSLERQSAVAMFTHENGRVAAEPAFIVNTLRDQDNRRGRQAVGTVHVHPNGRCVYVANRASTDAENTVAVFEIEHRTGRPVPIQHVDTNGIHCRTFHIDPTGRLMVCSHIHGFKPASGPEIPTRLSLFRIEDDGKLMFARSYDMDTGGRLQWWTGMISA